MKILFAFFALFIISCSSNPKATLTGDLAVGIEKAGTLEQETSVSYSITVDDNTYIAGWVDQISVDVVVSLLDKDDEEIDSFDNPAKGHEPFTFSIEDAGTYRLKVTPFEEESGDYTMIINVVEPIATDRNERADQLLSMYSQDVPGAVIGVIENGKMVYSQAYGKANLTHDLDFKLNTPTNIGSVSKQFTAYAILLLEQRGSLSTDDDVRDHIPELPDFGEVITLNNLLNHTNGYREVYNLMPMKGWHGEDNLLRSEVINTIKNQKELQAPPNTEFNYNNSAFIMLAEIVERKTDTLFPLWMKHNVFNPLGMTNSYVRQDPSQIIPKASQGYSTGENGFVESGDLSAAYGAGGIYTTPEDLAKWLSNFNEPVVGSKALIQKMVTPRVLKNGDTLDYGFGIGIGEYRGLKRYSHGGADIAHRAMLTYFPEINSGVITLSNNASFSTGVANDLVNLYFEDQLEKDDEEEREDDSEKEDGTFIVSEEILTTYVGKFKLESLGMIMEYSLEEGSLMSKVSGQSDLNLTAITDSTFTYNGIEATALFKKDATGIVNRVIHTQGGQDYELERLPSYEANLDELTEYSGKYFSEELETFYTIKLKDSTLIAVLRNFEDIELSTAEKDNFSADVFFIQEMVFKRNGQGTINGFEISNGRTKGVSFEKQ
jgi:CubicO group peptidase (beta-lactamase class C family)